MNNTFHEQQFFNALRDIFVGAEIEGDSGFINLMQIKSRYYQNGVFPKLKKDIDQALGGFPGFREELFDKLYTFFQRYFSESGSIYFRYTPLHQNIYEKVYTDDRDVVLFWKTHMLYYVKTDRIFKSLKAELDGVNFYFDASNIEHKRANEKRDIVFSFREVAPDGTLVFDTAYSVRGRITKIEQILRDLRKEDQEISDEILEKAFRVFEKQSEVDYFINKNARAFLEEQFDLWLYQYLFAEKNVWSAERIAQLQALKEIVYKVIGFISQFEDELVKIWNKPKFVRNSHYILTLDHLIKRDREDLLESLFAHQGMAAQMGEWVELGMIDSDMEPKALIREITTTDLTGEHLHPKWLTLPLDTKHFPDLEIQLLSIFDDLDDELDGWLVHSENYQALNTLYQKFRQSIKTIYIDPPYNATYSEIDYVNNYVHSSWLSMMENRIRISSEYLNDNSINIVAIDENEQERLGLLLSELFPHYEHNCIVIIHNHGGIQGDNFSNTHEYAYFSFPKGEKLIGRVKREEGNVVPLRDWGGDESRRENAKNCFYPIIVKNGKIISFGDVSEDDFHPVHANIKLEDGSIEVYPIDSNNVERKWRNSRNTVEDISNELFCQKINDEWVIKRYKSIYRYKTVWTDNKFNSNVHGSKLLGDIIGYKSFQFPKSLYNVEECLNASTQKNPDAIILDYFAGSGTSAHAVMSLNRKDGGSRKYILVEMGDHFNDVILPRIKKIAFHSKWKDGKPVFEEGESGISHFVKYYDLEQYEETLQKVHYEDADLFDDPNQDPYHAYVFLRDLKLLESIEIDTEADRVRFHPERLYPDIDLAETLSHLRGKWIKGITEDFVEFQDGEKMSLTDPDWETLKPMVWWG
ncbi:MAG: site-specific DNA-methyltransferase [Chloroflexota bacterium]|nr:site-specific DNA-methyltransferase [Chloroflexota bacterium]